MSKNAKKQTVYWLVSEMFDALEAASEHLDYTGYGDAWEHECAMSSKLPIKIASALDKAEDFLARNECGEE
jgi:hypothetical protein